MGAEVDVGVPTLAGTTVSETIHETSKRCWESFPVRYKPTAHSTGTADGPADEFEAALGEVGGAVIVLGKGASTVAFPCADDDKRHTLGYHAL